MSGRPRERALVALFFVVLVSAATYPLPTLENPHLPINFDALFNTWRLSWIAHQLRADPIHLFDANIFHPAKRTLAYSDAMPAAGLVAAPLLWAGLSPIVVHNLVLLGAFISSALACFALCRRLTGDVWAALIGGIVFSLAPYRFGHIAHLELQLAAAMPLALLVLHREVPGPGGSRQDVRGGAGAWRTGLAAGALIALQGFCSLYYFVFFGFYLGIWSVLNLLVHRQRARRLLTAIAAAAVTGAILLAPYLAVYASVRQTIGPRQDEEIARYSAELEDYLRVSNENKTYRNDLPDVSEELSLFPGFTAIALGMAGLVAGAGRQRVIYAALGALSVVLSLGTNTFLYSWLLHAIPLLYGFRAPARFTILVLLSLAVLCSFGVAALRARWRRGRFVVTMVLIVLLVVEYWAAPLGIRPEPLTPGTVYQWLAMEKNVVLLELPVPEHPSKLWNVESMHEFKSIYHWNALVNGYSGAAPRAYFDTIETLGTNDPARIRARLRELDVDYVILHQRFYTPEAFIQALELYSTLPDVGPPRSFADPNDPAIVIPLRVR